MRQAARLPQTFPEFSTKDLDGDAVTSDILAKYNVTMIKFWATWSQSCVEDMPNMAEVVEYLENSGTTSMGLIGILIDADDEGAISKAGQILFDAVAYFTQLRPSRGMRDYLDALEYIPTTIFVDDEGNLVGPTMIGAHPMSEYLAGFGAAMEEIMQRMMNDDDDDDD